MNLEHRYRGCLIGLACGDAVGTTVEFSSRGGFAPVTDMVGGGPFDLPPGAWTDDTAMAICLAQSLLHRQRFDANDQMNRYLNWWHWGYPSPTGECFDIGSTVKDALIRFSKTGDPLAGSTAEHAAGNGSLMRLAPVVMYFYPDQSAAIHYSRLSSQTTHGSLEAIECCALFAEILCRAFSGKRDKADLLTASDTNLSCQSVRQLCSPAYADKSADQVKGSGYSVESLEAALWCFATASTFEDAILLAANLGDDADTTAAITGQLAGAYYGIEGIPTRWRERLFMSGELDAMATGLLYKDERPVPV